MNINIIIKFSAIILILFNFIACEVRTSIVVPDFLPPSSPRNVFVINGDNRADLSWDRNYEEDINGYNIYISSSFNGQYTLIGSTKNNYFIDNQVVNGNEYYYAVTAFDYNLNESELSADVAYSVPRPEGFDESIFDYRNYPHSAGYSFTDYSVKPFDDLETDFFFENYNGVFYLNVWDDSDIQDVGLTNDIYDVQLAPAGGWEQSKDAIAIVGHTYIVWTWDNHFAKVRVKNITANRIVFDWAFQLVKGNRVLKSSKGDNIRKPLHKTFSR